MAVQDEPVGSNFTCANPLALLAVMDPVPPDVRSRSVTFRPFGVSVKDVWMWSPEFMNRSAGLGVYVPLVVASTGLAGPVDLPFFVMKAKLTYSSPTVDRQAELFVCPVTGLSDRLSMLSAAHHMVGLHELAPTATCQVGHGIQPGG